MRNGPAGAALLCWLAGAGVAAADPGAAGTDEDGELTIARAAGPIAVDGDLSDSGWQGASRVDVWYETNPGDNVEPRTRSVGLLAYDDRFFYAGFEFDDPDPGSIRAPLGDRDNVPSYTDYGGVILDTRNDGRTGILLLANPRGVQYDAVSDDTTGNEDSSLDLFWDASARRHQRGWTLEIRVPFSSLRYGSADPQTWSILLYRNWPRGFRYQMFSSKLPRGGNCFVCRGKALVGLAGLPHGGHAVLAPYLTASSSAEAVDGAGSGLSKDDLEGDAGVDVKWTPNADTAVDATLNPDFSQVESDVAQISVNERFALYFPERRPFFLEGLELFSTPIQAVYTRSITSPRWGARSTGKIAGTAYTALVAEDRGGGSVILPGPDGSELADQEFRSVVAVGRARHDFGRSFVSVLATDREVRGGGHNRVYGPDFQWRPDQSTKVTGQVLMSDSRTPRRPDLASEWDGRRLRSHALDLWASRNTRHLDLLGEYRDLGDDFRADAGFLPQVGYRETFGETGWTVRPAHGFISRLRTFFFTDRLVDTGGDLISRTFSPGVGMDGRWNSFGRFRLAVDRVRSHGLELSRSRLHYTVQVSPPRYLSRLELDGFVGEEVDFDNDRVGRGARLALAAVLRPSEHLELRFDGDRRWLNVAPPGLDRQRLFTAQVSRLRATWMLSARSFLRAIGQYVDTRREPALYGFEVARHSGEFAGSLLFSYKLNWQSVLFVGYGDNRELDQDERLGPTGRQVFVKLSYAFQR